MSEPLNYNYYLDRVRKLPASTGRGKNQLGVQGKQDLKTVSANEGLKQQKFIQEKNEVSMNFESMINEFLSSRYKTSELQELLIISRLKKTLSKNIEKHDAIASKISYRLCGQELMDIVKEEFSEILRKIQEVARENRALTETAGKNVNNYEKVRNVEAILQKFSLKSCFLNEEELEEILHNKQGLDEQELQRVADGRERDFVIGLCRKIVHLRNNREAIERSLTDKLNIRKSYKAQVMDNIERTMIKNKEKQIKNLSKEEIINEIIIDHFEGSFQSEVEFNEEEAKNQENPTKMHQGETDKFIELDRVELNKEIKDNSICEDSRDTEKEVVEAQFFEKSSESSAD